MDKDEPQELVMLYPKDIYRFPEDFDRGHIAVEWITRQQGICDLDLTLYAYDERARLVERIDSQHISKDASCVLLKQQDSEAGSNFSHKESLKIDLRLVNPQISSILLYLDGGPRNFQFVQTVSIQCTRIHANRFTGDFLPSDDNATNKNGPLFKILTKTRKTYQGMAMCVLYKDGWNEGSDSPQWQLISLVEPVFVTSMKDKQEKCHSYVINHVPALDKFRPRLFNTILDICAALSSHSLPKLKKKFQKSDGLPLGLFTDVLFKQLFETHPKIIEESEAAYTVAMIQEMFFQIDYNGDGSCNWDEFTSFCVQTGLLTNSKDRSSNFSLEQYVIEYQEAILERDHVLSAYRFVALMRHVPEIRKLIVIAEDADNAMIFDEKFRVHSQLYPNKVHELGTFSTKSESESKEKGSKNSGHARVAIYDMIHLDARDMYCYTSSDHCITVCKEFNSMGGKKVNYQLYNRFFHTLLHLKLCWSAKQQLLCSVASDRVVYGWNIDTGAILFQISRHTDIITDFISVDHLDLFMTCSMDRRIVLWSATSRRVKGILLGHKRGVRNLSVYEHLLLSAGFECDARLWELVNKDCIAILKGHRHPIVCAKLMCDRSQSEKEHRAVTVDESGEFRLWNIHVKEKASEAVFLPTLQVFEMTHSESPLNRFRFLAIPFNSKASTSYYSDLIACGTKLLHFIPEKIVKEYVVPATTIFNSFGSTMLTGYGRTIITYDITSGEFISVFEDITANDISALCIDGARGRKMYVGTVTGEVLLVNTINGSVIDFVHFHSKEVTSICEKVTSRNSIYSSSMDGHIRLYEESNGKIHLHHSLENAFGSEIGITRMKLAPSLNVIVASSTSKQWGVFHDTTMKKLFVIHEEENVSAFEIIGASHDKADEAHKATKSYSQNELLNIEKETILTLAIATNSSIFVYTVCVEDFRGVKTFELVHDQSVYINDMIWIKSPTLTSMNYSSIRASFMDANAGLSYHLVAATDEGSAIIWDVHTMRFQSEAKYRVHFQGISGRRQAQLNAMKEAQKKTLTILEDEDDSDKHSSTSELKGGKDINNSRDLKSSKSSLSKASTKRSDAKASSKLSSSTQGGSGGGKTTVPPSSSSSSGLKEKTPSKKTETESQDHSQSAHKVASTGNKQTISKQSAPTTATTTTNNKTYVEFSSKEIFPLPRGQKTPIYLKSNKYWNAHSDSIPQLIPLHTHNCFMTMSHDGYQRIWNLDQQCLGELALPNLTEQMKTNSICKEPGSNWRFILERIPITKQHIDLSNALIRFLKQSRKEKAAEHAAELRRNANFGVGFKGFLDNENVNEDSQAALRRTVLKEMLEPPKPSEDFPPSRLPTKEEKELLRLSATLTQQMRLNTVLLEPLATETIGDDKSPIRSPSARTPNRENTPMKKSSNTAVLGGDASLLISTGTGKGLWNIPGERDIFGNVGQCIHSNTPDFILPAPFSEASLKSLRKDNLIDAEGQRILRKMALSTDRVQVYERAQPTLLIRNTYLSTSVSLPSLDSMRKTEISFGVQKDMYKNAEKVLNDKDSISKQQVQNAVAKARIDFNVRKINSMIHLIQPPSHDEVILPKNKQQQQKGSNQDEDGHFESDELQKLRTEEQKMRIRLMKSAAMVPIDAVPRALDKKSIDRWVSKVSAAIEPYGDHIPYEEHLTKRRQKDNLSQSAIHTCEKKLQAAIKGHFRSVAAKARRARAILENVAANDKPSSPIQLLTNPNTASTPSGDVNDANAGETGVSKMGDLFMSNPDEDNYYDDDDDEADAAAESAAKAKTSEKKFVLTTRMLLPYYKLEAVHQFMDIFAKVDENFSGDIDVNEWIKLFSSLNETVSVLEARMIFMRIDKDSDGFLTMRELIPVVFNKANKEQLKLIIQYTEMELTKKIETESIPKVTHTDLELLFEAYDAENIGFVEVGLIKERVRTFYLSEQNLFYFMESISSFADDEMLNLIEFKRLFSQYVVSLKDNKDGK